MVVKTEDANGFWRVPAAVEDYFLIQPLFTMELIFQHHKNRIVHIGPAEASASTHVCH